MGAVLDINGQVVGLKCFGHMETFSKFFKKLVRIYALDALNWLGERKDNGLRNDSARRFLNSVSRVVHPLLDFTLTDPDVRRYRIRLFQAGYPDSWQAHVNRNGKIPPYGKRKIPPLDKERGVEMEGKGVCFLPMTTSGGVQMVKGELWHEVHFRYRLKEPKKAIARALGLSVKTVRKILNEKEPRPYRRAKRGCGILSPYEGYILQRMAPVGYCARAIYEELVERGYRGSYDTVKLFVRPLRQKARLEATVRFETPPGRQAQVDFGVFDAFFEEEGRRQRVSPFTMVLGHSRFLAGQYFSSQNLHSVLVGHLKAFGEVPEEILYDRMKTVVLETEVDGALVSHPALLALANHYGFRLRLCRPYRAKTKGKVERPIGYIRRDFFLTRGVRNLEDFNEEFQDWLDGCANLRRHGTTARIPGEELIKERGSIILTSNRSFSQWNEIFGDPVVATAILDRILHHSTTINIKGSSYRLKEKVKAGLLKSPEVH